MTKTRRRILILSVAFMALAGLSFVAMSNYSVRWRLEFVAMKLSGRAPYMSWREVADVLRSSGARSPLARSSPPAAATPASEESVRRGRELFLQQCAQCHGAEAEGGMGPNLTRGQFQYGESDAALARTITEGVAGTAMQPRDLPSEDVQHLIAFLRSAIAARAADPTDATGESSALAAETPFDVTLERLAAAAQDSAEWLTYSGSYDGQRHSRLSQISRANVDRLHPKWMFQIPGKSLHGMESAPLVVGDAMFVTMPPNRVWALDARTGREIWSWSGPEPAVVKASNVVNRGVAIYGNTLYLGTMDAHLVALNAQTGKLLWDVEVAEADDGYAITSAPLAIRDKVIVGVAGGEYGIRGFIDAYSTSTGERLWRFYTIPGPGEPGHETWGGGDAWRTGGAPTWLTGSYDPELDLIYWGVGNPGPDFLGDVRPGINLYSNCVVAVEAATGRLRWYFQFTPHDEHDWDAAQIPVLADADFKERPRKLMYWANRNAFYYILDRETGEFLHARAYAEQSWAVGIDSKGAPIERPGHRPTAQGTTATPAVYGATNWWSPSYDPGSGTIYVPTMIGSGIFTRGAPVVSPDGSFRGSAGFDDPSHPPATAVRALDASTGALRWEYRFPPRGPAAVMGGLLSTDGGLVFAGDQTHFVALDALAGRELWHFGVGGEIAAAPITYLSEGHQHVTLAAGRVVVTFSIDGR